MNGSKEKKLLAAFNKYSGRAVLHPMTTGICQTSREINAEAKKLGLTTRIIYPGEMVTMDYSDTRLNVNVVEKAGSYKVGSFNLG